MELDGVVFYGRLGHLALQMYGLDGELSRWRGARVLDCPGGPSSLAALLARAGVEVVACDPLYGLSIAELRQRSIADLELSIAKSINSPMLRRGFDLEQVRRHHLRAWRCFWLTVRPLLRATWQPHSPSCRLPAPALIWC